MLSMSSGPLEDVIHGVERSAEIARVMLRTSSDLAECKSEEIEDLIQRSIVALSAIEHAEQAGWFLLGESGILTDIFHSPSHPVSLCSALRGDLHRLPWCLAQLNTGKAVLISDVDDLFSDAEVDQQFLRATEVRSLALLPSNSVSLGRTVLILSSNSKKTKWSEGIVDQCTLLENIFSNAYQRRLAQDESQVNERRFQQLFTTSISAMAVLNCTGQFVLTNKAFCDLLGYSADELLKMKCDEITSATNYWNNASLPKHLQDGTIANHQCEQTLIRKDQSLISARIKVDLIERSPPEVPLSLLNIEDLTEQKNRERELSQRQTEIGALASLLIQSQECERKRLSRELHDDIGQRLSLAASEVALLASEQSSTFEPSWSGRLESLRDELDSLCTDVHEMSHDLHSYKLQHLGLKSALKDLCRRLSQPAFRVDLYADDVDEPTSKDVSLCLYRVAQESLNNALKHAHASNVAITLTKLQNMFYMTIQDSGIGFDSRIHSQGLGFISMSERLKLVKGQFRLHSTIGHGTEIWVQVPDEFDVKKLQSNRQLPVHSKSFHSPDAA
jgi:PAS domain S-box-containing protein